MLRRYVFGLVAMAACAWPLTVRAGQPCAQVGQICGTPTNQSNPDCCAGLVCAENARCVAGASTTSTTTTSTTTLAGQPSTTTTTLAQEGGLAPVIVTARDVSLKAGGGSNYTIFRGHAPNQYERDQMEAGLLGQWIVKAVLFMETQPKCAQYVKAAFSTSALTGITDKLEALHQYEGRTYPPTRGTWLVKNGGNFYQILGYVLAHAHACALSDPAACAKSPLMNADMADLLDLTVESGMCVDGATFAPVVAPPMSDDASAGLVNGKTIFPPLSAADDALLQKAIDAHMGGNCGAAPAGSVQAAQLAFEATAPTVEEMHFRTIQPFIGGCNPAMSAADCCAWKLLEHREYMAWANAVRTGDWGLTRCAGGRHLRMHLCALLAPHDLIIRMPPCDGSYPDDTDGVPCNAYLANPTP